MKNHAFSILFAALLLFLASCNSNSELSGPQQSADPADVENVYTLTSIQFSSSEMELGKLDEIAFHQIVKATGMFNAPPENRVSVSSYFGGIVKNIQLLTGERVKKGQTLFTLENPDYVQMQQDYLEAKGQLNFLKSDFERQKNLAQDNVTSQKKYLKAESDYTVMKVKFESLSKKLALMGINPQRLSVENIQTTIAVRSPINGFVTAINVSRGSSLSPAQPALSIVNTDHLHLELNIFEKDLPKIEVGQPILFTLQNDNTNEYQATVHLVNKIVDTEKRTVGIHGHLTDKRLASKFNPGMYVEADILTTSDLKPALPQSALVEAEGKHYVLVLDTSTPDSYTFTKREVNPGTSNNDYVEIINAQDFKDNSEILTKGSFNLITE